MSIIKRVLTLQVHSPERHNIDGLVAELAHYPHKLNTAGDHTLALSKMAASSFFVLVDVRDEVWGCVALRVHERYAYAADAGMQMLYNVAEVDSIFVRQQYRGRGLSRLMIERMMFNVHALVKTSVSGVLIEITADDTALIIGQPLPYLMRMHDDCQALGFSTIGLVCADNGELLYMDAEAVNFYMERVCGL